MQCTDLHLSAGGGPEFRLPDSLAFDQAAVQQLALQVYRHSCSWTVMATSLYALAGFSSPRNVICADFGCWCESLGVLGRTHSFPECRRALLNSRWAQKFPLRRGWISHILNGKGGAADIEYEPIFGAQKRGPEHGPPSENNKKQYEIDYVREAP